MAEKRGVKIAGMVLVVGAGKTGLATVKALENRVEKLFVTDTRNRAEIALAIDELALTSAVFVTIDSAAGLEVDVVIVSPGVSIEHPALLKFKSKGVPVISEIEAAYGMTNGRIVAVTGTNGKTTVTALIGEILKAHFPDVRVAGNIGAPFIEAVRDSDENTLFALEVSSYQLEGISAFRPVVAVALNVTPDHLERHRGIERYAAAKARIFENQDENDAVVLNFDDPIVKKMAAETRAKTLFFGALEEGVEGAFEREDSIIIRLGNEEIKLMDFSEIQLTGRHNRANVMAAALAAGRLGTPWELIRRSVMGFHGLEHRMEKVAEIESVSFVNDSKATNEDAAVVALRSFEPGRVVLIIGGDDKGLKYPRLIKEISKRAKHVVLLGVGLSRLADEVVRSGFSAVSRAEDMEQAVSRAKEAAERGDVVLLSPASSSFDLFANFEERGRAFKRAAQGLKR